MRFITKLSVSTAALLTSFSLQASTSELQDASGQSASISTSAVTVAVMPASSLTPANDVNQPLITSIASPASIVPSAVMATVIDPIVPVVTQPVSSTVVSVVSSVTPLVSSTEAQPSVSPTVPPSSPIATSTVVSTPVVVSDPIVQVVIQPNRKVTLGEEIKYIGEEIEKGVKYIFGNHKVSKSDLKNVFSKDNWNKIKHCLDYDGNGSVSFTDIENDVKVTLPVVREHAQHFKKFIMGYKEQLTNNALFALLPAQAQNVINAILDTSQNVANNIANGATIAINTSGNLEKEMNTLSAMITTGQIDVKFLVKNKAYLNNLVQVIDKWKASGNTSEAATTIVKYLENMQ